MEHREWLEDQMQDLFEFGEAAALPNGGFAVLSDTGEPQDQQTLQLLITTRMTHVNAIASLLGIPGAKERLDHGMTALLELFADEDHGGWFSEIDAQTKEGVSPRKEAYAHAFVLLAATSALQAGHADAEALLDQITSVIEDRFWSEDEGWMLESWDNGFSELEAYRGANSNMHSVEAFLAAYDAGQGEVWLDRALQISERIINQGARSNNWRVIEHFDDFGAPNLDYNQDDPAHQYRPYGATVGHAFEWSRLLRHLHASLQDPPQWLLEAADALYERALLDGWNVDGEIGFVYTTDWEGEPVVRERLHWVLAEALGATAALWQTNPSEDVARRYHYLWQVANDYFIDHVNGSWFHELDPANKPSASVWSGKPDLYHALQALLIPRLPLAPSLTAAVASDALDTVALPPEPNNLDALNI